MFNWVLNTPLKTTQHIQCLRFFCECFMQILTSFSLQSAHHVFQYFASFYTQFLITSRVFHVKAEEQGSNSRFALRNLRCEFEFLRQKQLPGTKKCGAKLPLGRKKKRFLRVCLRTSLFACINTHLKTQFIGSNKKKTLKRHSQQVLSV